MHASSMENMRTCYRRYVEDSPLLAREEVLVLDVGGANVNGGYRDVFSDARFRYLGVDLAPGEGIDIVLEDPNQLPLPDASVDIVVCGQMLEHCEFFWLVFAEMMRVLRPDGYLFLIAPSAGPIHRYPVDCYRFYPDAYRALAKHAGVHLVECWLDERGPWRDLVGVFARQPQPPRVAVPERPAVDAYDPVRSPPGSAAEEAVRGVRPYIEVLDRLHATLAPALYLEIGVRHGRSLALARGPALGVDPAPELERPLPEGARVVVATSDDFFAGPEDALPTAPELAFIDGMHLFEYALRDFMHVERRAGPNTVVVIDDILPVHPAQAARTRRTRVWTGDVWKLQACLAEHRPDLFVLALDTAPSGLLLVAGLDPGNRVLWQRYNPIVRRWAADLDPPEDVLTRRGAVAPAGPVLERVLALLAAQRTQPLPPAALVARLRRAVAEAA